MGRSLFSSPPRITRRRFLQGGCLSLGSLALYSGELERHWAVVHSRVLALANLPAAFEQTRIVQISDIHLRGWTEPAFLRHIVRRVNEMKPDIVALTGDFVSFSPGPLWDKLRPRALRAAGECAEILSHLECTQRYAVMGNHDLAVGTREVTGALAAHGITVLNNRAVAVERGAAKIWIAGMLDPSDKRPRPERAIPAAVRQQPEQPVILLCHSPDYADELLTRPVGQSVDLMLSGHTHGGQVRLPLIGALARPPLGKKYTRGWFQLGHMQLYVSQGIGTVGLPFRFDCPPEITELVLTKAVGRES
jgi:uncharacterized protein